MDFGIVAIPELSPEPPALTLEPGPAFLKLTPEPFKGTQTEPRSRQGVPVRVP
jgi:hypothetical protein